MAAYMKTDMPFYGVQKAGRSEIARALVSRFDISTQRQYERVVTRLWRLPHREEKYMAVQVAQHYHDFIAPPSLPLYEKLIREGAWWDFVDTIAIRLVGEVLLTCRRTTRALMDEWISDADLWIRRTALISQIGHKERTDHRRLFRYCRQRAAEREFFIRKGIGWALREYSYTAPERVLRFLQENADRLSGLSFREGAKALRRFGYEV
jgi:3-methyladenine DNA glycosylase AlkD